MTVSIPLLALALGCGTETIRFPPDLWQWDSSEFFTAQESAVNEDTVTFGCDAENTGWAAQLRTDVSIHGGELFFFTEDPEWIEVHPLDMIDRDIPDGWRDFGVSGIADGMAEADQVDGVNSALDCEADIHRVGVVLRLENDFGDVGGCVWTGPAHASLIDFLDKRQFNQLGCDRFEM